MVEPELVKRYVETGRLRLVWHDFAWQGEESVQAAQAARCAARQGKFWEYHDHLYRNQRGANTGQFSPANLKQFAADLGLDTASFSTCVEQGLDLAAIQADRNAARARGAPATPYFLINGRPLAAGSLNQFAAAIEAEPGGAG